MIGENFPTILIQIIDGLNYISTVVNSVKDTLLDLVSAPQKALYDILQSGKLARGVPKFRQEENFMKNI